MEEKQKSLQEFYDKRIRKTRKCKEIETKLLNELLDDSQKKN